MDNQKTRGQSFGFWLVRGYINFINAGLYFRRIYVIGVEKFPKKGEPVVVVSNHRNGMNDPLSLGAKLTGKRFNVLGRADVFKEGIISKFLHFVGMYPVHRLQIDGYSAMKKNDKTFEHVNNILCRGELLLIYPEGKHQFNQTLIEFNPGYIKMAFCAAESLGFEKEVFIIPTSNYYNTISKWRADAVMTFGDPVPLSPYYEKYKEDPRAVIAETNTLIRDKVLGLMVNIQDVENYQSVDFLKDSQLAVEFACEKGCKPNRLPKKLLADREFVAMLDSAKEEKPEKIAALYSKTAEFVEGVKELKMNPLSFAKKPTAWRQFLRTLGLFVGLPLFIVSIIPTFLVFLIPYIIMNKVGEKHFTGSMRVGGMVFISYPICCVIPSILIAIFVGIWFGLAYFVLFHIFYIYACNYINWIYKYLERSRFRSKSNREKVRSLNSLYEEVVVAFRDL